MVFIGRYKCNYAYKSVTGNAPKSTQKNYFTNVFDGAHAIGDAYWLMDWLVLESIRLLYLVEFADWDVQAKIGYGGTVNSTYSKENVGYTDNMPYHTGTTLSSRTEYDASTQYRNIECLWDNGCNIIAGVKIVNQYDSLASGKNGITKCVLPSAMKYQNNTDWKFVGYPGTQSLASSVSGTITRYRINKNWGFPYLLAYQLNGNLKPPNQYISDTLYWSYLNAPFLVGSGGGTPLQYDGLFHEEGVDDYNSDKGFYRTMELV